MNFLESGSGRPLVLVHGSLSDARYWSAQLAPLGEHHRTIAVSLRHHHPASWSAEGGKYGVHQHASDLVAFLQELQAGPSHVVAHSRGAHVTVLAALQRPELFRVLVLADPAIPLAGSAGLAEVAGDRRVALERIRAGDVDGGLEAFIDAVSGSGVWRKLNTRRRQMARDNATTLPVQFDDPEINRPVEGLPTLQVPVLLVGGERSPPPYPATLDALERVLPQVRRVTLAKTSHAMNAEDPSSFNAAVLSFLSAGA